MHRVRTRGWRLTPTWAKSLCVQVFVVRGTHVLALSLETQSALLESAAKQILDTTYEQLAPQRAAGSWVLAVQRVLVVFCCEVRALVAR